MHVPCRHSPDLFTQLANLELADDFSGDDINILIGADQMYDAVLSEKVKLLKRLYAVKTLFGYALHGSATDVDRVGPRHTYHIQLVEDIWNFCMSFSSEEKA